MKSYDVIIVGAGPAGLSCAGHLSGSGLKVLVLEKSPELGRKICSGEISPKLYHEVDLGDAQEWKKVTVGTENGTKSITYAEPFLKTVGRKELETFLRDKSDAEIRFSEPVVNITADYVETSFAKYEYSHLVGADGAFSSVRKHLGLPVKQIYGWAYHFIVDKPCSEFRVYWLPKTLPCGYGYMMSKNKDKTMIGGAMTGTSIHHLAPKVKSWASKEFSLGSGLKSEGMKGNADYRGWRFRNTYLVGEAAGLLNPLTTEGIYYAIRSGEGVAKHILGDPEGEKIMRKLENDHKWQVRFFDLATNPDLPLCWMVHWILEDPRKGIRRKIFDYVFWKFMKS